MIDALTQFSVGNPSCFFAIGEQLNALAGLMLCLAMAWDHMPDARRSTTMIVIIGTIWFLACGVLCWAFRMPSLWTVLPTAPLVVLALKRLTDLSWEKLLIIVSTASYIVATIYYLSLVVDVAALGERSANLRVGWPGLTNLLLLDVIALLTLWRPLRISIPSTFDSPSIGTRFWRLIWLFPFISAAIVIWCLPADTSSLLDTRVLEIAFTVTVAYSCFMALAYLLLWYMIKQSDRLLDAHAREHHEAMQTLQLQHLDDRIREARLIRHNTRHHIHSLQVLAEANDLEGIKSYLESMSQHPLLQTSPMQYCEHTSLNAVLVYYCDWVRHIGANVDVKASVPQYIGINNAELCSLVGNLLENATEAIMKQTDGDKRLTVRIRYQDGPPASLFVVVDNTYDSAITRINDDFASSKHGGAGLGTQTVRRTVQQHHGTASFDYDGDIFRASVMLCLDD